jgi:hypothetical protein
MEKIDDEMYDLEKFQAEGGYKWVLQNGRFVPAGENWQPLDLSPQTPAEAPWPGDFCYVSQRPDCKMPECQIDERQLAYVHIVDKELGFANVRLVSRKLDMAGPDDVILSPDETGIPFDVVVEQVCGPVYFDQLSRPVGYTGQDILDKINEGGLSGELDFPTDKKGEPISGPEDPRYEYALERLTVMKKLFCFCLNKILYEDDLAAEADATEEQPQDEPDDSVWIDFPSEDEVNDDDFDESDYQIYKIRHDKNQWIE